MVICSLLFYLVIRVSSTDRFSKIQSILYSWDKPHEEMMYYPSYILVDLLENYFVKKFCIYVNKVYWPVIFFIPPLLLVISFSDVVRFCWQINFLSRCPLKYQWSELDPVSTSIWTTNKGWFPKLGLDY